jgi:hypothetical protein
MKSSVRIRVAHNRIVATAAMIVIGVHFSAITSWGKNIKIQMIRER